MRSHLPRRLVALAVLLLLALPAIGAEPEGAPAMGWFVVAYPDRITSADRARLEQAGARAIQYWPADAYLAWLDGGALAAARRLDGVQSIRPLPAADKVAATLASRRPGVVSVITFADDPHDAATLLGQDGEVLRAHWTDPSGELASVVLRTRRHPLAIAERPDVLAVGPAATGIQLLDEGTSQIVAGNVAAGRPVVGYRDFLDGHDLDGSGVTIAIADSGVDDTHPDLAGRVGARINYAPLPDAQDYDGHGTHVAGIAAGSGAGLPMATDPDGFAYGLGVAPNARLLDLRVLNILEEFVGLEQFPPFEQVSRDGVRNGAVGWNASWGSGEGSRAGYTETARTMDIIARDADWETPGAQPFTLVFAAGNSGASGPGAPTEAKNLIAVASSLSHRAGNIDQISSFSSRGPTVDGRIGPTVAAPGQTVVAPRSLPVSVLCNTPPVDATPMAAFYGTCSGTSMAAPHVTGAVALITQWWRQHHDGATPSPAMHKALLVNSATDIGGQRIPNAAEGWGRVNLRGLFDPATERVFVDQDVVLTDVGQTYSFTVEVADPSTPLKVTLAWSDAPAAPNAVPALVNDLDLSLVAEDGTVYRGNVFSGGWSVPGGPHDRLEVVENVFVQAPAGTYTVVVRAENLAGDGIPFSADATDQDFALVVSNARASG